jgi:hypothetical protein
MLKGLLRQMNLTMGQDKFNGSDPILVFDFLIRFFEEASNLAVSEAQAFALMPYYLSGDALKLFNTACRGKTGSSVRSYCEAVQWLLRTYANAVAIRKAVQDFNAITQKPGEDEPALGNRVRIAAYRCGNVFTDSELMNVFVDGLHPATRSLVARFRESQGRSLSFEQLIAFARDEGESYRARAPGQNRLPRGVIPAVKPPVKAAVHLVDAGSDDAGTSNAGDPEMFGLLPDWTSATDHSGIPSTVDDAADAVLYGERHILAPRLAHAGPMTRNARPGWVDRPTYMARQQRDPLSRLICYVCYGVGHIASQCTCSVRDMASVKRNYEALTREEKERVPPDAYQRALAFMATLPAPGQATASGPQTASATQDNRASGTGPANAAATEPKN